LYYGYAMSNGKEAETNKEVALLREFKKNSDMSYALIAAEIGVSRLSVIQWIQHDVKPMPLHKKAIKGFLIDHM